MMVVILALLTFLAHAAGLVLCDIHHRGVETGIHHLLPADFYVLRYLRDGYRVAAQARDAAAVLAADEKIEAA